MTTIICITILAYCILGKDIKALMGKVGEVDCPLINKLSIIQLLNKEEDMMKEAKPFVQRGHTPRLCLCTKR